MPAPARPNEVFAPSRLKARRRKVRTYKTLVFTVFIFLLLSGLVGFFYIPQLRVRDVSVTGTQTIDANGLEQIAHQELNGRAYLVLPKDNAFLYSEAKLREVIMHAYPKVKTADIQLANFHTIKIQIGERTPAGLWCGETIDATSSCSYMDDSGAVYEPAPDYSGDAYVRWYGNLVGGTPLGGVYINGAFPSLSSLVAELEKEGLQTQKVQVEKGGDVRVVYAGDFIMLFTLDQKPESLLTALHAAESSDVFKDKKLTDLEYLDLRFLGNRLYYKMK